MRVRGTPAVDARGQADVVVRIVAVRRLLEQGLAAVVGLRVVVVVGEARLEGTGHGEEGRGTAPG